MPSFKETLDAIATHQRLKRNQAKSLTDLDREQLHELKTVWSGLPDPEKLNLIATLRRQAEDDALVDFDAVYRMAMEDMNADVRRLAVAASVDDDSFELLGKLLTMCVKDPDETVRAAVAERLGPFALEAELGNLPEDETREIERVLLDRAMSEVEAVSVRAAALASVGYFSTDRVRAELRRAVTRQEMLLATVRAMGRNIDPEWTQQLTEQMGNGNPDIRREAALAAADYADAVGALAGLVDDTNQSVRLSAISSLGQIGGPAARETLVYCYESSDPTIREAAINALAEIDAEEDPLGTLGRDAEEGD